MQVSDDVWERVGKKSEQLRRADKAAVTDRLAFVDAIAAAVADAGCAGVARMINACRPG